MSEPFYPPEVHVSQPVWWFPSRAVGDRDKPFAAQAVAVNRRVISVRLENYATVAVMKHGVRHVDDPDVPEGHDANGAGYWCHTPSTEKLNQLLDDVKALAVNVLNLGGLKERVETLELNADILDNLDDRVQTLEQLAS